MAEKKVSFTKLLWFDWVLGILLIGAVIFVIGGVPGGRFGGAIAGIIILLVYSVIFQPIWAFAFPDKYRHLECSKCKKEVSPDADACPKCKESFTSPAAQ